MTIVVLAYHFISLERQVFQHLDINRQFAQLSVLVGFIFNVQLFLTKKTSLFSVFLHFFSSASLRYIFRAPNVLNAEENGNSKQIWAHLFKPLLA